MVRGASRWLPWSRRGRLGRGLSDTTPARCQRVIVDVAPRSTGGFGRTVTRGCVASGRRSRPVRDRPDGDVGRGAIRGRPRAIRSRSDGQRPAGRSPAADLAVRARPGPGTRSSGWVTPTQRPWAGSTVKELVAERLGDHLGQQDLGLLGGVGGGVHGGLERLVEGRR